MSTVISHSNTHSDATAASDVSGAFVNRAGERFYCIRNVDDMPPFFVSVISSYDHWLFASSTGGLTAGRVSPDTALFPYITVDRIHESLAHTGPRTIVRLHHADVEHFWEPFNTEHAGRYETERNLYKNVFGNNRGLLPSGPPAGLRSCSHPIRRQRADRHRVRTTPQHLGWPKLHRNETP